MWPEDWWQVCNNALMWTNSVTGGGGWLVASVNWSTRVCQLQICICHSRAMYKNIEAFWTELLCLIHFVSHGSESILANCRLLLSPSLAHDKLHLGPATERGMYGTKQFLDFRRDTMEDETFQKLYARRTYQWHFYWCCLQTYIFVIYSFVFCITLYYIL